ncbi:SEC-C domain-containing protein [Streptomyces griseiscabiei]|uniref:SEC-C domain-containing protein n=1 Tax=Streptomyces griseiscabiei TaxID=2993540 RepID=A0ABU4KUZ4_9ACTN|nr:SEC-C domain-containing protein [Streptomyces griseiscabiei]MBZ3902787.1 SEC-C domain-containing protein [Streptomyces griseiscabiei]MDX2907098.1 SEC-C domain-containing protein [Streptomyces griseiscabiei]
MSSKRCMSSRSNKARKARQPAAVPPGALGGSNHAQFAEESERLAERCPEEREELLREAAEAWLDAGEHERAVALYERLLDPASGGCREPDIVDAWRINALWEAGKEDVARAAAAAFRARHPRDPAAWSIVAEVFEAGGETAKAAEWFTSGVTHALGVGATVTADVVADSPDSFGLEELVIGRHRVRRLLGEPHDDWDHLADALHEQRASLAGGGRVRPLDELHDPLRRKRLEAGGTDAVLAEFEALAHDFAEDELLSSGRLKTCVLFWPPGEFARLLQRLPSVVEAYGDDHADYRRQVERTLRELSDEGAPRLAVGRATVGDLTAYAEATGSGSLDTPAVRSAYAAELARTGQAVDWPPPRNGPCWCGSERKYKKCCGDPALR